jgi:hypothetical protein
VVGCEPENSLLLIPVGARLIKKLARVIVDVSPNAFLCYPVR